MHVSVVIDASVVVSWLVSYDVNHDASRLWIERYNTANGLLVAPALLMVEVAAAIARQTGQPVLAKAAIKNLYAIHTLRVVPVDSVLVRSAVNVAADLQLRAGDAIYVAVAHELKIPLLSWDKERLQRGGKLITTCTPGTYHFELPDQP